MVNIARVSDLKPFFEGGYNDVSINSNSYKDNSNEYKFLSYIELSDGSGKKACCSVDGSAMSPFLDFDSSQIKSTESPFIGDSEYYKIHEPYISVSKNSQYGVIEMDGTVAVPISFVKVYPDLNGYKDGPVNFYWAAEAPDGTEALYYIYYKGEVIIPSGTFDAVSVVYGNEGQDKYPWISAHMDIEDGFGRAVYSIEGEEIIPPLKNCYIERKNGKFTIFSYDDHRREHFDDGYSWDELREMYTEPYSKAKHKKYEVKGYRSSNSSAEKSQQSQNSPVVNDTSFEPYQEWVPCYECNGSGRCHYCSGDGWDFVRNSSGEIISSQKCIVCYGTGTCQACHGNRGHYETNFRQR